MKSIEHSRGFRRARVLAAYVVKRLGLKAPFFSLVSSKAEQISSKKEGEATVSMHKFSFNFLMNELAVNECEMTVSVVMECHKTHAIDDGDDSYNGDGYNYVWEVHGVTVTNPGINGFSMPSEIEIIVDALDNVPMDI